MRPCRLRSASFARVALALAIMLAGFAPVLARERGPRVDVVCPAPPIPVKLGQQQVLVYELHITDFDTVPLTLKRLEVFGDDETRAALVTLADTALSKAMIRVGEPMAMGETNAKPGDAGTIAPGARAVIYLWIELPAGVSAPAHLLHRIAFSAPNTSVDATLQAFDVPVRRASVPLLALPFHAGTWLAGRGPSNDSDHRRTVFAIDGHIYSPERFAIDWVKVGPNGDSYRRIAKGNEDSWGWSEPILAVADGEITDVLDGILDNPRTILPPVTLDNIAGNYVVLRIAPDRYVTYAHLQNGSIKVRSHQQVHTGDVLGLLGNSGNTTGPHLHLQVTDTDSVLQSEGVPFIFSRFSYLGPGSEYELNKHITEPWSDSIPPGEGVLEFPSAKN